MDIVVRYFDKRDEDLLLLGEKHVVFYDHDGDTLELESVLMRRVLAERMGSERHKTSMQLVRTLLVWQEASMVKAEAERNAELRKGASKQHSEAAQVELTAAR